MLGGSRRSMRTDRRTIFAVLQTPLKYIHVQGFVFPATFADTWTSQLVLVTTHSCNTSKCVTVFPILCFVDRASRYTWVMKTNMIHYLSTLYCVNHSVRVSGISVAHHQEVRVYFIYTTVSTCSSEQHLPVFVYIQYRPTSW